MVATSDMQFFSNLQSQLFFVFGTDRDLYATVFEAFFCDDYLRVLGLAIHNKTDISDLYDASTDSSSTDLFSLWMCDHDGH